jgi:mRNA (guanine-N7-)-methyltransferase
MALHFQIKDCMTRYNGDTDQQQRKKFSFPARLLCTDCYEVNKREENANWLPMTNLIVCFFAHANTLID